MGRMVEDNPKTIVILQWESGTTSARRFWTMDSGRRDEPGLPKPVPVNGTEAYSSTDEVYLPPHLLYDSNSKSILMHNLSTQKKSTIGTVTDDEPEAIDFDVELLRWGPGLHLAQTQAMKCLFRASSARISQTDTLSPPAIIQPQSRRSWDDDEDSSPNLLTAVAMADPSGKIVVKYRARKVNKKLFSIATLQHAYKSQEQTVRPVAMRGETAKDIGRASPSPSIPIYMAVIGCKMPYLLVTTVGIDAERFQPTLSLHMMAQDVAVAEMFSLEQDSADNGLRWQSQSFKLPAQASGIVPLVTEMGLSTHLLVFYFLKGALHYTCLEYAGSGTFKSIATEQQCFPGEPDARHAPRATPQSSRRSLSSYILSPSLASGAGPKAEKERRQEFLPARSEACQPYAVIAKGYVWIFYRGVDGRGTYVRHRTLTNISNFDHGWETASWVADAVSDTPGMEDAGNTTHFIPVVVPGDFMCMK